MYYEKMNSILNDLENKDLEIAGGSVVGMILSTINSLIKYIAHLNVYLIMLLKIDTLEKIF